MSFGGGRATGKLRVGSSGESSSFGVSASEEVGCL